MRQSWVQLSQVTDFIHLLEMWSFTCPLQFCCLYSGTEQSWVSQWKEEQMKESETWLTLKHRETFLLSVVSCILSIKGKHPLHTFHAMVIHALLCCSFKPVKFVLASLHQCHFCFLSSSCAAFKFSLQSVELSADHSKAIEGFRAEHQSGLPIFSGRGRVDISAFVRLATLNLFILQLAEWGSLIGWTSSS